MKSSLDFMHDLMHSRKMKEKTERSISQFLMIMFSQFAQCNTYGKKFVSFFSFACQIRFFFFFFFQSYVGAIVNFNLQLMYTHNRLFILFWRYEMTDFYLWQFCNNKNKHSIKKNFYIYIKVNHCKVNTNLGNFLFIITAFKQIGEEINRKKKEVKYWLSKLRRKVRYTSFYSTLFNLLAY